MSIVIALLIFSAIILFHEFGHFLLAKLNHIVVLEFSLGMGPRLFSFEKGNTRYSLKVLPFGGSCMMLGEDMDDRSEGSFGSKKVAARISVVAAGPLFNFLMAYVLSLVLIGCAGYDKPELLAVSEGMPAAEAGLKAGDVITSLNGEKIHFYREVSDYVNMHQDRMSSGDGVRVTYLRGDEERSALVVPVDNGEGRYVLGISGNINNRVKASAGELALTGIYEVKYWINMVFSTLKMMFAGDVSLNDVSGPVGAVSVIGETYQEASKDGAWYVWLNMLNIAVLLSANLGVMNLLPLPALDGGRLIFLLLEAGRGRQINPEIEGKIHVAGLMMLMALMAVVMINDVRKIFY